MLELRLFGCTLLRDRWVLLRVGIYKCVQGYMHMYTGMFLMI